jgi:arylsulfatase A-like enzyme
LYNAFVSSQDQRIGRLVAFLEQRGLREDTILIFQSDHGHSVEERAHFGGGDAGPFRGSKQSLFEGGLRVPSIISFPKRLPQNAVRHQIVHAMDWLPTLAELCGVELIGERIDGKSMVAILESDDAGEIHETLFWQYHNQWAVRQGPWKLIRNPRNPVPGDALPAADQEWFLSNLEQEPGERNNLAVEHPEIVNRLDTARPAWMRAE